MKKEINAIEYIVYESGMILNDKEQSIYFPESTEVDGDIVCLNLYAVKDLHINGYQYVGGNQYVRYINLYLFIKWTIRIDRDSDNIKIGCVEKTESEWVSFFTNKQKINLEPTDRNYLKIEKAFYAAVKMRELLTAQRQMRFIQMIIVKVNLTTLTMSRAIVTKESLSDLSPGARARNFELRKLRARSTAFF